MKEAAARDGNHFNETVDVFPLARFQHDIEPETSSLELLLGVVSIRALPIIELAGLHSKSSNWTVCTPTQRI